MSGGPPGAGNVAVWDSTVGANTSALGGSLSVAGLKVTNPGGLITIGATTGATLTLGSSGIDMSQAMADLTINPNMAVDGNQTWTVAGGRLLRGIAGASTSSGSGTGDITISRSAVGGFDTGTAQVYFNQNGNTGSGQTGWSNYSGNLTIESNVKVSSQGNAAVAFGSGTITLAGGQVFQRDGNWTFGNNIAVTADSVIGNDSSSGLGRAFKLLGDLTSSNGSGLTFTNATTGGTRTDSLGFILAGANASTYGSTTISANSRVRVGGNATATVAGDGYDAGNRGSLGTGAVILEAATSELAFTRTDPHTVANNISGLGTVVIGGTTTPLAATSTQVVSFTGANTYTGGTRISTGTLRLGGTGVLGGGSYAGAITANATLHFDSTANQTLSGVISGTGTLQKSNTGTLTLSGISNFGGTFTLSAGTVLLTDNNTFSGPVTIASGGTLRIGNGGTAGFIGNGATVTNDGAMVWNRTNTTSVGNGISGSGSVTQQGTGTLALGGASTYTGTTTVNAGTLSLTGSLSAASTLAVGGGTFSYANPSVAQTLGGLTVNVGSSVVTNTNVGDTQALNLGAIARTPGGTVNFSNATATDNVVTTTSANTNGILGPWATVGSNWAANDGTGKIVAYTGYTDVARLTPGTIANTAAANVRIIEGSGTAGNIALGASTTAINTLLQSAEGGTGAATVDTASSTLRAGGVMVAATAGGLTIGTAANSGTLTAASAGGDLTLLNDSTNALTINATIANNASASSLTKAGAGDLVLGGSNTYGGGTSLGAGTIRVGNDAALGTGSLTINGGTLRTSATANRTLANNVVLAGSGAIASDSTSGQGMRLNGVISGSGDLSLTSASTGILTFAGTNTFTGATTVSSGYLAITNSGLAESAAVSLGANTRLFVGVNGTTGIRNLSGDATASIRTDFTITGTAAARTLSVNQSADGTYAGTFTEGSSRPISLEKTGAATLSLTNSGNTYTGSTTVSAGTLRVGGGGRINSGAYAGAISIAGAATLHHDSTAGQTLSGTMSGGGTLQKSSTGALQLTGTNNTFSGLIDISAGDVVLGNAGSENGSPGLNMTGGRLILATPFVGGTATIGNLTGTAGTINTQFGADVGIRTLQVNQTADGDFAGNLQDGGGSRDLALVKTGPATLTLSSGSNTYTGGTTLSQGTLIATNANALGTGGTVTINDASTGTSNTAVLLGSVTMGRPITVANQGSGTVTLGSAPSVALPTFSGAITLAKDVTLDGTGNTDRLTFTGGIGGTGNVTLTGGTNRVVFGTTANTYAGGTSITAGSILQLGFGSSDSTQLIPNASVVSLGAGSFLKLAKGNNNETIGGLVGSGTVRGHEAVTGAASVLTISNAANHTFAGILQDGGAAGSTLALAKFGTGTQTLTGGNTYTGSTTVGGGKLLVNGSIAASSLTTVASAATLGGSGSVGATLIQGGGFHAPGTSPGIQTVTNGLEYQSAATLTWELFANTTAGRGTNYDGIDLTGGPLVVDSGAILALDFGTLAGGSSVSWSNSFWGSDQSWTIIDVGGTGAWDGSLYGSLSVGLDAFGQSLVSVRPDASFSVANVGGDLTLQYTAVPEPATLGLAAAGLAALAVAGHRWRRR